MGPAQAKAVGGFGTWPTLPTNAPRPASTSSGDKSTSRRITPRQADVVLRTKKFRTRHLRAAPPVEGL